MSHVHGNGNGSPFKTIEGVIATMKAEEVYDLPSGWETRAWQEDCLKHFKRKRARSGGSYFSFLISAGVGSGKTIMSALVSSEMLNRSNVDRIVYVCPNLTIRSEVIRVFRRLNIELVRWNHRRHGTGEPSGSNGVILTYSKLTRDYELMGRICDQSRTLVIFDEIHHLGDKLPWGDRTRTAFEGRAACIVGLSGTPYRGDNRPIPFVAYKPKEEDGLRIFEADYTYTLGKAVADGVCRRPAFTWLDGEVRITNEDGEKEIVNWDRDLGVTLANRRLRNAVRPGSRARLLALRKAVEFCRRTRRKLIIFVGGDSSRQDGGGVRDAAEFLPEELSSIGINSRDICTVVSEDESAHDKIRAFGESNAWILIAVNMVSEGVDIPQLSAALFLTQITARSTTIQRIGRVLRGQGEAHIFMFKDPRYVEVASLIETQINHEVELGKIEAARAAREGGASRKSEPDPGDIGLTCEEGGVTVNGTLYPLPVVKKYREVIAGYNFPEGSAFMSVIMPLIVEGKFGPVPGTSIGADQ